ncbi:hypothetical protein SCAR479_08737 [Seiridium cardinale]|uniref:Uncharacterized protein n=1 Tax=Seiridium cardinale TaxID=138064 RepID=A0ABR2XLV1_9PEZI
MELDHNDRILSVERGPPERRIVVFKVYGSTPKAQEKMPKNLSSWRKQPPTIAAAFDEVREWQPVSNAFQEAERNWETDILRVLFLASVHAPVSLEFAASYYARYVRRTYVLNDSPSLNRQSLPQMGGLTSQKQSPFLEEYSIYWVERQAVEVIVLPIGATKHSLAVDAVNAWLGRKPNQSDSPSSSSLTRQAQRKESSLEIEKRKSAILEGELAANRARKKTVKKLEKEKAQLITRNNSQCKAEAELKSALATEQDKVRVLEGEKIELEGRLAERDARTRHLAEAFEQVNVLLKPDNKRVCDDATDDGGGRATKRLKAEDGNPDEGSSMDRSVA